MSADGPDGWIFDGLFDGLLPGTARRTTETLGHTGIGFKVKHLDPHDDPHEWEQREGGLLGEAEAPETDADQDDTISLTSVSDAQGNEWEAFSVPSDMDRRIFDDIPYKDQFPFPRIGWLDTTADDRTGSDRAALLCFFASYDVVIPVGYCDEVGQIYHTNSIFPDPAHLSDPVVLFGKDSEGYFDMARIGGDKRGFDYRMSLRREHAPNPAYDPFRSPEAFPQRIYASQGGIFTRSGADEPFAWTAGWLESDGLFCLEQTLIPLPDHLKDDLLYRDAMTVAFFLIHMYPQVAGLTPQFGVGNLTTRLRLRAPVNAFRTIHEDVAEENQRGLSVSGIEDYFVSLSQDVVGENLRPGLKAVHGKEPVRAFSNPDTNLITMIWDGLDLLSAMQAIRMETAVNRIHMVSDFVDAMDTAGYPATEASLSQERIARLDMAFLTHPAHGVLISLPPAYYLSEGDLNLAQTPIPQDSYPFGLTAATGLRARALPSASQLPWVRRLIDSPDFWENPEKPEESTIAAYQELYSIAGQVGKGYLADADGMDSDQENENGDKDEYRNEDGGGQKLTHEWAYRQALSDLLAHTRIPFRYDVNFRSNLESGSVAIAFTSVSSSLMPTRIYDPTSDQWVNSGTSWRERKSTGYNLSLGLIFAAYAFGLDPDVQSVSIRIDSLGLDRKAADVKAKAADIAHDLAENLMAAVRHVIKSKGNDFLSMSEASAEGDAKSAPKDGDQHGPVDDMAPRAAKWQGPAINSSASNQSNPANPTHTGPSRPVHQVSQEEVNKAFSQLMEDVDLDSMEEHAREDNQAQAASGDGRPEASRQEKGDSARDHQKERDEEGTENPNEDQDKRFGARSGETLDAESASDPDPDEGPGEEQEAFFPLRLFDAPDQQQPEPISIDASEDSTAGLTPLVTVTFTRQEFRDVLPSMTRIDPREVYRSFGATMKEDEEDGSLQEIKPDFDIHDDCFSPRGAHEEPEMADRVLDPVAARAMNAQGSEGLAIQREDLLHWAADEIRKIADNAHMSSAAKAETVMSYVNAVADPELKEKAALVTSSLIDGAPVPEITFTWVDRFNEAREKSNDLFQAGQFQQAFANQEKAVKQLDDLFHQEGLVPRYFNSYADRVLYNRLFATEGERTVLIPDELFVAHCRLADAYMMVHQPEKAAGHLNQAVAYAPTYTLVHLRQATGLAAADDWESDFAAAVNAVSLAQDREDASFGYYRMAFAAWMKDDFRVAAAAYLLSLDISSVVADQASAELRELEERCSSQGVALPTTVQEAADVLSATEIPVWPNPQIRDIIQNAARVCVEDKLFVPAKTLLIAWARMEDQGQLSVKSQQLQVLRSLNA